MAPASWIAVAFVTAIVVMVIAATSSASSRKGVRQFIADVGWKARHEPVGAWVEHNTGTGSRAATLAMPTTDRPADEEGGVAELFGVGEVPDSAYVDPTPLTEPIARVTRSLRSLVRS